MKKMIATFFKESTPFLVNALVVLLALAVFALPSLFAQGTSGTTVTPDAGVDQAVKVDPENPQLDESGGVKMANFLIDNFEDADLWFGEMWVDEGIIQIAKRQGGPIELRENDLENSRYVLGSKINFFKRSFSRASIEPPRPIRIPGITKSISVWVNGKNRNHQLYAVVNDMRGAPYRVLLGNMNFSGWKKLTGRVPEFILQEDQNYQTYYRKRGLEFVSLLIDFDVQESLGTYFSYFDNLEAETNIYQEEIDLEQAKLTASQRSEPLDDW